MISGKYYIGLDIGTNSVGWCATDFDYDVIKRKGNALWGVRLFDAAETAAERRTHRCCRRRIHRRNQRVRLVQKLFESEVCKIDPLFFTRLQESKFRRKDKNNKLKDKIPENLRHFTLFADQDYTDKEYYLEFPTIYHLRTALIVHKKKFDIRFYYLAISHFMKHRGYFYQDIGNTGNPDICRIYKELEEYSNEEMGIDLHAESIEEIKNILCDNDLRAEDKKKEIIKHIDISTDAQKEAIGAMCGTKFNLQIMFNDTDISPKDFSFLKGNIDNLKLDIKRVDYLTKLYDIYRYSIFDKIKEGFRYFSESQVNRYNDCHNIINELKKDNQAIKREKIPSLKNRSVPYRIHYEELEKIIDSLEEDYPVFKEKDSDGYSVRDKLLKTFSFKIPYYVGPLDTYNSKKSDNCWMIRKEGEEKGEIFPWNFDEKVDRERTAEVFLQRMLRDCQNLFGEKVLPKNSLLYSKFMVLNEINNIKINGYKISSRCKKRIFDEFFKSAKIWEECKSKKYTRKRLENWLLDERIIENGDIISGIDETIQTSLKSYHEFKSIVGSKVDNDPMMIESMIYSISVFGNEKKLLRKRIEKDSKGELSKDQIDKISDLSYSGWGCFSREFLNGITDNGRTIIDTMMEENENLEAILSKKHHFQDAIDKFNRADNKEKGMQFLDYKRVCELAKRFYPSPAIKRSIWQALLIVNEIRRECGEPSHIFIEFAREKEKNQKRTISRKQHFLDLYRSLEKESMEYRYEIKEILKTINEKGEREFNDKLCLYVTQMGKDIYTGDPIELNDLQNGVYDIDHIIPQSIRKDDSLWDNKVLTKSDFNQKVKKNYYPLSGDKSPDSDVISPEMLKKLKPWWFYLKKNRLITEEKYDRLTRIKSLTNDERFDFINRQLVETRQSTKLLRELLQYSMPKTVIVCTKASLISEYRRDNRLYNDGINGFWKSRMINDYHHAKDAYLSIVVGNVYYTMSKKWFKIIEKGKNYNIRMNSLFNYEVSNNPNHTTIIYNEKKAENSTERYELRDQDRLIWIGGEHGSIVAVRKMMLKNNILYTRYSSKKRGGFWDQKPLKKSYRHYSPLKTSDDRYDVFKYGGYKNNYVGFMLVESDDIIHHGRKRSLERIPAYLANSSEIQKIKYLESKNGSSLKNPVILISMIKINSMMKVDGVPLHISGSYDKDTIKVKSAVQLQLNPILFKLINRIESFINKYEKIPELKLIESIDHINEKDIIFAYNCLEKKINDGIFKNVFKYLLGKSTCMKIQNCKKFFMNLDIENKCKFIVDFLKFFVCREESFSSDLKEVKLSRKDLERTINKNISSNYKSVKLIHQSVTGLFEYEVDLLTVGK